MNTSNRFPLKERYQNFIGGQWVSPEGGRYFESDNPSTGEHLSLFARSDHHDISKATHNAAEVLTRWQGLKPAKRGQLLLNISRAIRTCSEDLALLETLDTGKPLSLSRTDVETCARYFEYYGGAADKILGEVIPASNEHLLYTLREPFGVTGHITPWNAPINQAGRGAAAALAAGNAVVMKPAEQASITTLELARLCAEEGLPPGIFNVVTGFGEEAGDALARDPQIRKLSFTGSVQTGRKVLGVAAGRIIPVTAELGGKSAFIVFADANLDAAANLTIKAFVRNSGQVCSAGTRLLVEAGVVTEFSRKISEVLKGVTVGNGIDDPTMGPLISRAQLEKVRHYIESGKQQGADLLFCGNTPTDPKLKNGFYTPPMVFSNVKNNMTVARDEIFGPVACIIPFAGEDEAISIANDSEYGLAGAVWTENIGRAHRVARQIQSGQVYINDYMPVGVEAPFGGFKNSGYGREKGLEALREYTQVKAIITKY